MAASHSIALGIVMAATQPLAGFCQDLEELYFLISPDTVRCISTNLALIESRNESVVYVHPPSCPEAPENPLSIFTTAEAPSVAPYLRPEKREPDRLIVLSREQLSCFKSSTLDESVDLWRFFPGTCSFEAAP